MMIIHFNEPKKNKLNLTGGKGLNLINLYNNRFNVPNGFVITTKAYEDFIEINELKDIIVEEVKNIDMDNYKLLEDASKKLKKLITDEKLMEHLEKDIKNSLKKLKTKKFAVRSSATTEDLLSASFAGQQDTYLNVKEKDIMDAIKKCWASLFNARAIFYRYNKKIPHHLASMAVVVQEMVDADFAGVIFTVDPVRKKHILVEAAHGLGEKVVSGSVTPSSYLIDRKSFKIIEKNVNYDVDENIIINIAKESKKIEGHYKKPQDIEFAVKNKEIFILQSRAITTL